MRWFYLIASCLVFFALLCETHARNPSPAPVPGKIDLLTWNIPLFVESKDKGLFIKLVREIGKRSKKEINVTVMPPGSALMAFSNNKAHGYFPAHELSMAKEAHPSLPFYLKKDYIFFRKENRLVTIKDLEGKKVGLTFRYFYDPQILANKKIRIEYADDDFANMKKLGAGKIDAFVVEERSGIKVLQESGFTNIDFDRNFPLSEKTIFFAFQGTAHGEAIRDLFNKYLEELKADGTLERLFSTRK